MSNQSEELYNEPMFLNIMEQVANFEAKTDVMSEGKSLAELELSASILGKLIEASKNSNNPDAKEKLALFSGFLSWSDYLNHVYAIRRSYDALLANYRGFEGLSNGEIKEILDDAIDAVVEQSEVQSSYRSCVRYAKKRRKQRLADCARTYAESPESQLYCEESVEMQYQGELAECEKLK